MAKSASKSPMSAHTKKLRTKVQRQSDLKGRSGKVILRASTTGKSYEIPKKLFKTIEQYEVEVSEEFVSVEGLLSKLSGGLPEWAENLRGLRAREGLTQKEFGDLLSLAQSNISAMENGKRPIGKELAQRIEEEFKIDYRLLL